MSLLLLLNNQQPYHDHLLETANRLLDQQPTVAVVVAMMACEIYSESVISEAFKYHGIGHLEDSITALLPSNSLGNERVQNFYTALTGDQIQLANFWQDFKEAAKLRNKAVHHGATASRKQGLAACAAAEAMTTHLKSVMSRMTKT